MLTGDILIIGGYGAVGRIVALSLANQFPNQVVVAGRSYEKANVLAQESGGKIRPYQFDVTAADENLDFLDAVAVVVMCLDVPDMQFVRQCLQRGIHYVDITAEDVILQPLEALAGVAKSGGSTAILSVGLSPGLTNLLARHAQAQFETLHHIDIHGFLGLGEAHGAAAARWTLRNLNADYQVRENGRWRQVNSFGEHKQAHFPDGLGQRRVYRFNLADQHVVVRTLDLPSVSTWVTFDPMATTWLMAFLRRTGLSKLLRTQWIKSAVANVSTAISVGSTRFAIQVAARGAIDKRVVSRTYSVTGDGQGRATGLVTAQVVEQLLTNPFPSGVFHSEQLLEPLPFIRQLAADGIVYHESEEPEGATP